MPSVPHRAMLTMALATSMLTSAPVAAQVVTQSVEPMIPASGTILDIRAEGRTTRTPDMATIRAGVVSQAPTAAAALADNAQRMARVLAALKRAGIAVRDIATANVGLSPQYRYAENQPPVITGYQATNTVVIRFRDVARSGTILDTLVAQGANQIDGPNLSLADPDSALDEARVDAVKRARAKAELYARAAGLTVAWVVSIDEAGQNDGGGGNPMPMLMARKRAEDSSTQVAAGETDVTVSLSVRFLLK